MLKNLLLGVALLFVVAIAVVGGVAWQSTKGISPEKLEAKYMTADDRFVVVAGARVRVREEGSADAPAIILLHGFSYSLESWDAWAARFKDDYRVIRYDLLGHGLTGPDPQERYAPLERAEFLGEVMDALGLQSAIVAGNSLGGLAAWRFASEYPGRVDALVLISPAAYSINGVTEKPVAIPAAMKAYLMTAPEAGVRVSAELVYADDTKITPQRLEILRDMMRRKGNGKAMIASIEEFTLPDPAEALSRVTAPSLILWGEEDLMIPVTHGRQMVEAMPNALLITYPDVGHAAQEEAPNTSLDAIEFLKRLTLEAAAESE